MINLDKSQITFSPSLEDADQELLMWFFGIDAANNTNDNYLGLPSFVGKNKKATFQELKEKVWKKSQAWKGKLFSVGGCEVLIKAVAQATSAYAMSVFKIPSTLCHEIQSLVARFWWGGSNSSRKIHWMQWKRLCKPKAEGGLGFRDVGPFNQAILAK